VTDLPQDVETAPDTTPEAPRRGLRVLVLLPVLVFLGLAGLFGIRLFAGDPARIPSALIGQAAPAKSAELAGRVTLVNIWASWCAPCQEEHPTLMQLASDRSIRLVGLNYKDKTENARRFLGTFGNPFAAVGTDPSGTIAIDWGVYGVPETFVIGPDGRVRFKQVGPLTAANLPAFLDEVRKASR
jgi:cytochrome c biogenesis protein CcmG/thiol:disulfide interchange protein DsbE